MITKSKLRDLRQLRILADCCIPSDDHYTRAETKFYWLYVLFHRVYVIHEGPQVVGMVVRSLFTNTFGHLFVDPQHRNKGHASALVQFLTSHYPGIRCFASQSMVNWYQWRGFHVVYVCLKYSRQDRESKSVKQ